MQAFDESNFKSTKLDKNGKVKTYYGNTPIGVYIIAASLA